MAIKPVELRVTFAQETWSSHEINKNNTKIEFLSADFIQRYPKYDVNNVRLPDIVGPTSYVWYTWNTSVKDERDRQLALRPKGRRKVGKWEYCADGASPKQETHASTVLPSRHKRQQPKKGPQT